jgi:hypothetical protein
MRIFRKKMKPEEIELPLEKKPLKQVLKEVIYSLENDITRYEWTEHGRCNCGLVVQAILNKNANEVQKIFDDECANLVINESKITWKKALQYSCSSTGIPMKGIFKVLLDIGLRPEDISHLEFLSNKVILKDSGIDSSFNSYYQDKKNLILYLKSWIKILNAKDEETNQLNSKEELEAQLLRDIATENYFHAAEVRDKLFQLV